MKAAIKKQWLKALRSGDYRQTQGKLKSRNGSFCCLGVLCDIQEAWWEWDGYVYNTDNSEGLPPKSLAAGLSMFEMGGLAERNDGESGHTEHSFAKIADYIEQNL